MTGFDAYKIYTALNLHFKDSKFDFFKYNGKIAAKLTTYKSSPNFWVFEKLAQKHATILCDLVLSNIVEKKKIGWPGELLEDEAKEIYVNWKKKVDGLTYSLSEDCSVIQDLLEHRNKKPIDLFKIPKGGYPPIIVLYTQNLISLETLSIFEDKLLFCSLIDKYLKNDFIWEDLGLRIRKYSPFLMKRTDPNKIKKVLQEKLLGGYSNKR